MPSIALLFCGFVAFFGINIIRALKPSTIPFQLLLQPCVIAFVVGLFGVAYALEDRLKGFMTDNPLGRIINRISSATMESFLLTDFVIEAVILLCLPFYIAVPLCFVVIWGLAILFNMLLKPYNKLISKIKTH